MSVAWHAFFATLVGVVGGWFGMSALVDSITNTKMGDGFASLIAAVIILPFTVFGIVALLT